MHFSELSELDRHSSGEEVVSQSGGAFYYAGVAAGRKTGSAPPGEMSQSMQRDCSRCRGELDDDWPVGYCVYSLLCS